MAFLWRILRESFCLCEQREKGKQSVKEQGTCDVGKEGAQQLCLGECNRNGCLLEIVTSNVNFRSRIMESQQTAEQPHEVKNCEYFHTDINRKDGEMHGSKCKAHAVWLTLGIINSRFSHSKYKFHR